MGSLYAAGIVVQPRRKEQERGEKAHRSLFIDRRRSKLSRARERGKENICQIYAPLCSCSVY